MIRHGQVLYITSAVQIIDTHTHTHVTWYIYIVHMWVTLAWLTLLLNSVYFFIYSICFVCKLQIATSLYIYINFVPSAPIHICLKRPESDPASFESSSSVTYLHFCAANRHAWIKGIFVWCQFLGKNRKATSLSDHSLERFSVKRGGSKSSAFLIKNKKSCIFLRKSFLDPSKVEPLQSLSHWRVVGTLLGSEPINLPREAAGRAATFGGQFGFFQPSDP